MREMVRKAVALGRRSWVEAAKTMARHPTAARPTGLTLSVIVSLLYRTRCVVRYRDGYWEYRWRDGIVFTDDPTIHVSPNDWATGGGYDLADLIFWNYAPKADDVVVDVGAGFGGEVFALRQRVGATGRVYTFEAHPGTFARLAQLCHLNGWTNVELVQAAVTDDVGRVLISDHERYELNTIGGTQGIEVAGVTLDDFAAARDIQHIDYLKMNIEGGERLAIRGMCRIIRSVDHICISCHDFLGTDWGTTSDEICEWLVENGFRVERRLDQPRRWMRYYVYAAKA